MMNGAAHELFTGAGGDSVRCRVAVRPLRDTRGRRGVIRHGGRIRERGNAYTVPRWGVPVSPSHRPACCRQRRAVCFEQARSLACRQAGA